MFSDVFLVELLKEAVALCYEKDPFLIEHSMEQASVSRIYYYMQKLIDNENKYAQLRSYNLDCEYNKKGEHIKNTSRCTKGTRPDIVLHKRQQQNFNLMVIEFKPRKCNYKKWSNTTKCIDEIKLEDFTKQDIYNYQIGVWVKLQKLNPKYYFYKNGTLIGDYYTQLP